MTWNQLQQIDIWTRFSRKFESLDLHNHGIFGDFTSNSRLTNLLKMNKGLIIKKNAGGPDLYEPDGAAPGWIWTEPTWAGLDRRPRTREAVLSNRPRRGPLACNHAPYWAVCYHQMEIHRSTMDPSTTTTGQRRCRDTAMEESRAGRSSPVSYWEARKMTRRGAMELEAAHSGT
jgi:hypothetical protein